MRHALSSILVGVFFFFNDTATTEIYTLSLHDALPIWRRDAEREIDAGDGGAARGLQRAGGGSGDRKSTRLNSSHTIISYAVFCLKKKKSTSTCSHHAPLSSRTRRH